MHFAIGRVWFAAPPASIVPLAAEEGCEFEYATKLPGVERVEVWIRVDGEKYELQWQWDRRGRQLPAGQHARLRQAPADAMEPLLAMDAPRHHA